MTNTATTMNTAMAMNTETAMNTVTTMNTVPERIATLRQAMAEAGVDACIVPTGDPHMSEYVSEHYETRAFITGFTGSAGTAIVTADSAGLWTDSRYFLQAADQLTGSGVTLFKMGLPDTMKIPEYLKQKLQSGAVISFDGRLVSAAWMKKLQADLAADANETVVGANEPAAGANETAIGANEPAAGANGTAADPAFTFRTDLDLAGAIWADRPPLQFSGIVTYPLQYAGVSRGEKIRLIREDMKKRGADVLILSGLSDNAWLLNLRGSDVMCNPVFFSFVAVTENEVKLYADAGAFGEGLAEELAADGIEILPYDRFYDDLGSEAFASKVMADPQVCSARIYEALPADAQLIECDSPVMERKCIKNPVEMEGIHAAHLKDGVAMCRFLYWLKTTIAAAADGRAEPITELSAAEKLHDFRAEQNLFMGDSFEAIVGYGPHAAIVHYSATPESSATLEPHGLVLIDSGGQYLDGTTDITRTIVLGPLTDKEKLLFTAVLRGHINLARVRFPKGLKGSNLDYLAHAPLWQMGLDYRHSTGHGVGQYLNVHEDPNEIYWDERDLFPPMPAFEEGMLSSDEPGYYETDAFGIRHESLLLCVSDGETEYGSFLKFEPVTLVPFDLDGVLADQMQPDEINYLNAYHREVYNKIAPHLNDAERAWLAEATREIG